MIATCRKRVSTAKRDVTRRTVTRPSSIPSGDWTARGERILAREISYIPNPLFDRPHADGGPADTPAGLVNGSGNAATGSPLSPLYRAAVLSGRRQRELFLRMNNAKHAASRLRGRLRRSPRNPVLIEEIEGLLAEATELRNVLVETNLRLVVAAARGFVEPRTTLEDLVSAGHLPLIRAVELFDVSRGYCFSTYATNAVRNHFLRLRARKARRAQQQTGGDPARLREVVDERPLPARAERLYDQHRRLADHLLACLSGRERQIIAARFGLDGVDGPRTFQEVADMVGLSKERVRVISHRAVERLQEAALRDRLELPELLA